MYYALVMGNKSHPNDHLWREDIHDWDRGLGAHLDYRARLKNKTFAFHIYDGPDAPQRRGIVTARASDEPPFNGGSCKGAIGCAGSSTEIFIRSDYSWALGERMDKGVLIRAGNVNFLNLSHVIAHEVGHFFGFPHVKDEKSIMNPSVGGFQHPRWHVPEKLAVPLFEQIAGKISN